MTDEERSFLVQMAQAQEKDLRRRFKRNQITLSEYRVAAKPLQFMQGIINTVYKNSQTEKHDD